MKFLIVSDAPEVVDVVRLCLELLYPGSTILLANARDNGLYLAQKEGPDLIILDLDLPNSDGFDICLKIHENVPVSIMLLIVQNCEIDGEQWITAGADDYIIKPFSYEEFLAKVQTVFTRSNWVRKTFISGNFMVNYNTREVWIKRKIVNLTTTEFDLLSELTHNAGQVLTHHELLTRVFGQGFNVKTNYLRNIIQRLRRKLGDFTPSPQLILTEFGVGYRFAPPVYKVKHDTRD